MPLTRHLNGGAKPSNVPVGAVPHIPAWLLASLLGVATFFLYWPAVHHDFINYDDPFYVTANPHVEAGLRPAGVAWAFTTGEAANWHPLTWLSLMLDVTLSGKTATGMHLTNVILHAADVMLLFWLLSSLTGALWRSAIVAALFGWHPVHVESVAWVSERKDVLSTFFGLLALLAYARYTQGIPEGRAERAGKIAQIPSSFFILHSSFSYWLSWLCLALGLLSKPMLVTWPFVFLLLDYWPLRRFQGGRLWPLIREKIPFFLLVVALSVVTFLVQKQGGAMADVASVAMADRFTNAIVSYARYLGKLFWPVGLAVFYPLHPHWPLFQVLLAAFVLGTISILAWLGRRSFPFALMGWLWYGGTLVPVIGLVQVGTQSMADRYAYIPSVGIFILIVWGMFELTRPSRGALIGGAGAWAAILILCMALTRHQLKYWQSDEVLFQHDLDAAGNNFVAHYSLGVALNFHKHPAEAVSEFNQALVLEPGSPEAHYNLGNALAKDDQISAACSQFQEALRIKPDYADAHNNLGNMLVRQGQTDAAIREFQQAIDLKPDLADVHYNLGNALLKQGRLDESIIAFHAAIKLTPDFAPAHYNLGVAFNKKGQPEAAIREFQEAIRLQPGYAIAHNSLGVALGAAGRLDEAIHEFQEAVRLNPEDARAKTNLERALALKNNPPPPAQPAKP